MQTETVGMFEFRTFEHIDPDKDFCVVMLTENPDLSMPDPVKNVTFVFGSNQGGIHGKGAALDAVKHYGMTYGCGNGPYGNAYAIPTKIHPTRTMRLVDIKVYVDEFIQYAFKNPNEMFLVTRIACGLAGYKDRDIAPMFAQSLPNCILPDCWIKWLPYLAACPRVWHNREPENKKPDGSYDWDTANQFTLGGFLR